jgi:hypothetical protein
MGEVKILLKSWSTSYHSVRKMSSRLLPKNINNYNVRNYSVAFCFMWVWNMVCNICKANPLQALTGPEDSRRLRLPDFKTIGT